MNNLLEYPQNQRCYSLPNPASGKKWAWTSKRVESIPQASQGNDKEYALEMMGSSSAESVQANLNRVILHNTEQVAVQAQIILNRTNTRDNTISVIPTAGIHEALEKRFGASAADEVMTILELHMGNWPSSWDAYSPQDAMSSVVNDAHQSDRLGDTDAALDLLYDGVDQLLSDGKFSEVNSFLESASPADYSLDLLLGLLTVTLPARSRLTSRSSFFERVESSIADRGENADELLSGLR